MTSTIEGNNSVGSSVVVFGDKVREGSTPVGVFLEGTTPIP
jgi:hypothetical protein